jgi:hypothetical protein
MSDSSTTQKIIDKIKESSNVLVTVSNSPSVDELSAALATTLVINKLDKHATAVFSGDVPPAIEFLNPGKTFENTVDSLRDFIIALDKEKADHLRYKVVDDMVKIFITPYRTTINESDLEFSQGDYNVELVLAIGVKSETDLDRALESHGRILHDATVAAISLGEPTNLGGIEWTDTNASSYSEMLATLADGLKGGDKKLVDEQIATAFLTGIVAATDRFSNDRTSSKTMTVAAQLMAAGANQQLIATKLEDGATDESSPTNPSNSGDMKDGQLNKIPQDDTLETSKSTPVKEEPKKEASTDGAGALLISHEPQGDVDAVSHEVASKQSDAALNRAEEELAKQAKEVQEHQQSAAADAAEEQLANQLSNVAPAAAVPSVADLQKDIAAANDEVETAASEPVVESVLPPVAAPSPIGLSHPDTETETPSFGGTLNATTEQAEEDKRKAVEVDRNKTILTHGGGSYATAEPAFQAPLNATTDRSSDEPEVHDIFAENNGTAPTVHAESIQPPAPVVPLGPTLADIEQQTHAKHKDARAAIDAALATEPPVTPLEPATPNGTSDPLPPLPPLPPMPDFSSLPPLPGSEDISSTSVTDTLGDMLPPAPSAAPITTPPQPADPSQFRIPGQ